MSSSCEIIFFTRATKDVLDDGVAYDGGLFCGSKALAVKGRAEHMGGLTRQGHGACDLLGRSNWGVVVRHAGGGGRGAVVGWWWYAVLLVRVVASLAGEVAGFDT